MEEMLRELGLTPNESKVYLAMLRLKGALAGQITEVSGIHRRNVYDALDRLVQKGLVSYVYGRKRKYFKAEPPERLLELLKVKTKVVAEALPKLNEIFQEFKPEVNVRVYSGKEGVKRLLEDHINSKTEVLISGIYMGREEHGLKFYFPQHRKRRVKQKVKIRAIFRESSRKIAKIPLAKLKFLPDEFVGPMSMSVYDGKVANLLFLETPIIVVVENKEYYEAYKKYFELLWKMAK